MRWVTIAVGVLGGICLGACDRIDSSFETAPINASNLEGKIRSRRSGGEEVRVWRDPETGCQYLLWERRQRGSMTPRLTAEGRPMCRL